MALVKSAGIDGDDSDNGSLSLSDSSSDEESNRFKKKNRKVNKHHVDCKENRSYSKKLKEQVQEILSKGVVSEIIKQTRGKIVECKMCGKKLYGYINTYKHVLKVHRKTAAQDEYLKEISRLMECSCSFCGETFIDSSSMNNHKETAHKDLDSPCPLCDYKSCNLSNLRMHVRNMHVDIGKKAFCHLCTASFRSNGSLRQHTDLNHYGNKYVRCETCKKQFYNKSQLRRHMKAHGSNLAKKFTCTTCGKCFNFEYNLKKTYQCNSSTTV
ncbi:fez family zinc finger protein 1-like [Ruditapes philippinarum]|uniref:fez family zinc finger protein 1-like n=1 Tax=Ruditapes philippinarum TaxID=129788 RepID=UPI00295A84E7|nr:fez family zinc finger protein 1-like [Ruditapes philippinarum]